MSLRLALKRSIEEVADVEDSEEERSSSKQKTVQHELPKGEVELDEIDGFVIEAFSVPVDRKDPPVQSPRQEHQQSQQKKKEEQGKNWKSCKLDLSDVPTDLPPIQAPTSASNSRYKGVTKSGNKWRVKIFIPSQGGKIELGTYADEEEAGIMYARARYKYPDHAMRHGPQQLFEKLDLSDVPMTIPAVLADKPGASRFRGVKRRGQKWGAEIRISSDGVSGDWNLGMFDSEEEAGIAWARARHKYPAKKRAYLDTTASRIDLSDVPMDVPLVLSDNPSSTSIYKGIFRDKDKWQAQIQITSKGGKINLGSYDTEEEAARLWARARFKYPVEPRVHERKPCPLDLSGVPEYITPIPSNRRTSSSQFKGVRKDNTGTKWTANICINSKNFHLGTFLTEEAAGVMYTRARSKYPSSRY